MVVLRGGAVSYERATPGLVRDHFIIVMIRWTGLALWEFGGDRIHPESPPRGGDRIHPGKARKGC